MMNNRSTLRCPHCFNEIDLEAVAPHPSPVHLSIICMSRGGEDAIPFLTELAVKASSIGAEFLMGFDNEGDSRRFLHWSMSVVVPMQTRGYIESSLNDLAHHAKGDWILRIDDDETITPAMLKWLERRAYLGHPAWSFPTAALWETNDKFITTPPFWPDTHVRLTHRSMATDWPDEPHGKPKWVNQARRAPVAIAHHKFLVKSYEERRAIADKYESKLEGGGHGRRLVYNCPEDVLETLTLYPLGDGSANPKQGEGELHRVGK